MSITLAVISTLGTIRLHRTLARQELHLMMLGPSLGSYLFQLILGIGLNIHPKSLTLVYCAAFLMIAQLSVALSRAWGWCRASTSSRRPGRGQRRQRQMGAALRCPGPPPMRTDGAWARAWLRPVWSRAGAGPEPVAEDEAVVFLPHTWATITAARG